MSADAGMKTVLIVDDSPTARMALRRAIEGADSDLRVVGEASDGLTALREAHRLRPDLITMDVHLGHDDGVNFTTTIMAVSPTRVVIVTGVDPKSPELTFRSLGAGALDVLAKLPGPATPTYERERARFVRTLRTLADVPVVRRRSGTIRPDLGHRPPSVHPAPGFHIERVLIGASTGGPPLLSDLLKGIPAPLGAPLVIVQHISEGFGRGFASWLAESTGHPAIYCDGPEKLRPGTIYIAPDDRHLRLVRGDAIRPFDGPLRRFQRPSIDELFESAISIRPSGTLAILLTGMGSDGAQGLLGLREAGAHTIAQEPSSCVVDGMPRSAMDLGAALRVFEPEQISEALGNLPDLTELLG
ncbi:MAG: response regulator [Myxococcales bacterium]|nr:response regulator [Myxococcales bacterium]